MNKGNSSVIYQIKALKYDYNRYDNSKLILKILGNIDINEFINKYKNDLKNLDIKDNLVDILYYGKIYINENVEYNYNTF